MKKILTVTIVLMLTFAAVQAEIRKDDKPLKGELALKLEQVWETDMYGKDIVAQIRSLAVGDNGDIYVADGKNSKCYILDKDGKLKKTFGPVGEGPGEIRDPGQANFHLTKNHLIVDDRTFVHYFDLQGNYVRSKNLPPQEQPVLFLSDTQYLSAHRTRLQAPDGNGTIRLIDTDTGKKTEIVKFKLFEGGAINEGNAQAAVVSTGLTPMMILGFHDGTLYYGMNDNYKITVADLKGNVKTSFGLTRKKRTITEKEKVDRLVASAGGRAPRELLERLAKTMADELNYFALIEVHNGLIYAHWAYYIRYSAYLMDIYAPDGKYLYLGKIQVPEEYTIESAQVIKNGYLYLVQQNEDGEQSLHKYKISLPTE